MADLTPEPDTQDLLKRNVLGPAIFVLGAFVAVMMALDSYMTAGNGFVGDLARSIREWMGALPAFLAGAGTAWAGARLFLQDEPDETLHHLAGWILVSLAMCLVLAPIKQEWGGRLGITGQWKVAGFFLGLAALFAPVWFFWLRDRFVLPDESEMPESLSQTLQAEGGSGISAEEADALLPVDDESFQPARQNPELAALLAESLAGAAGAQAIETTAPSPYPNDVRKSGGIPAGTVPIEAPPRDADGKIAFAAGIDVDGQAAKEAVAEKAEAAAEAANQEQGAESVHRWAPKERRLAGQTLGEDAPADEARAPRKLQVNDSATKEATPLPKDVHPIEDMVDIPPRPIWEAEEAGDDTAGAIADALFGDGPIGPVRTLPHDEPGAAETIAADAERVPEFSLESPEVAEDEELEELEGELEEWEDEENEELEEDEEGEYAEADELEEDELEDGEEYEDEEYEDDAAAELDEDEAEEEEYEDAEAAELEEDEEDEEEDEYEDAEAAELEEEDEEDEYEDDEAAELEEDEEYEDEEEEEYDEAAELEEEPEEDAEYEEEEAAELEEEEFEEEEVEEPEAAESEVVLTPKAPPAAEPAVTAPSGELDMGSGRVAAEIVYDAGVLFLERGRVAVSLLQREFSLDFDESCEVMDRLQKLGLIGPYVGGHRRDILLSREEWLEKAAVG